MRNIKNNYNDHSFLKDINTLDLLKLKEMGLNDVELAKELKIPESHLAELYREYGVEIQGD